MALSVYSGVPSVNGTFFVTNVALSTTFFADGYTSPKNLTWTHSGSLTAGLSYSDATQTLSGTPTTPKDCIITVNVTDNNNGATASAEFAFFVSSARTPQDEPFLDYQPTDTQPKLTYKITVLGPLQINSLTLSDICKGSPYPSTF